MKERRTKEGYKLRLYIDAFKKAVETTHDEWVKEWIQGPQDACYRCQEDWILYLEDCIVRESEIYMKGEL